MQPVAGYARSVVAPDHSDQEPFDGEARLFRFGVEAHRLRLRQ